jgi:hypothetical protein
MLRPTSPADDRSLQAKTSAKSEPHQGLCMNGSGLHEDLFFRHDTTNGRKVVTGQFDFQIGRLISGRIVPTATGNWSNADSSTKTMEAIVTSWRPTLIAFASFKRYYIR